MLDLGLDPDVWPWIWLSASVIFALVELTVVGGSFIILPWAVMVEQHRPGFLLAGLRHDVAQRVATGLEGHKGPPGFYLVTILATGNDCQQ